MQPPPGGVQMPQLGLQHTSPVAHIVSPHVSPPVIGTHTASPSCTMHSVPTMQSVNAHGFGSTSTGTHTASPFCTSQIELGGQSIRLQGFSPSGTQPQT